MNAVIQAIPPPSNSLIKRMAGKFGLDAEKMLVTLKATCFRGDVSNEQMMALLVVAEQYNLNPWTKEVFAFPDRNNGIVPVVGVDGWSRIINSNPEFNGMDFNDGPVDTKNIPEWIECAIYRKDRQHPIKVKEYFAEVYRDVGPWKSHPRRMLRHKAMIQCARLAFGFAGIFDQDEAERIIDAEVIETTRESNKADPRGEVVEQDQALVDKRLSELADILAQDKEEHEIAAMLRDFNQDLSRFPDLSIAVFDKMAKEGIISKANYRKWLAIQPPKE